MRAIYLPYIVLLVKKISRKIFLTFCVRWKIFNNKLFVNYSIYHFLSLFSQESEELKWRSGPVSERLSSTLLMTRSGQLYHLMGSLSYDEMAKEYPDLNQPTVKKFKRGFPSEWQALLCNNTPPSSVWVSRVAMWLSSSTVSVFLLKFLSTMFMLIKCKT